MARQAVGQDPVLTDFHRNDLLLDASELHNHDHGHASTLAVLHHLDALLIFVGGLANTW